MREENVGGCEISATCSGRDEWERDTKRETRGGDDGGERQGQRERER